jgi:hypothetical protein
MQVSLDFPDAHGVTVLQKKPIDLPVFASESIFQRSFFISDHAAALFQSIY